MNTLLYSLGVTAYEPPSGTVLRIGKLDNHDDVFATVKEERIEGALEAITNGAHDIFQIAAYMNMSRTAVLHFVNALIYRGLVVSPPRKKKSYRAMYYLAGHVQQAESTPRRLDDDDKEMIKLVEKLQRATTRELAVESGFGAKKSYRILKKLDGLGMVRHAGNTVATHGVSKCGIWEPIGE